MWYSIIYSTLRETGLEPCPIFTNGTQESHKDKKTDTELNMIVVICRQHIPALKLSLIALS